MSDLINNRIKITTIDGRQFIGKLLSFDKHMNLVISECEEFRMTKKSLQFLAKQTSMKKDETKIVEDKRFLGLIILRGEHVISLSVEAGANNGKPILNNRVMANATGTKGTSRPLNNNNKLLSSGSGGPIRNNGVKKFNPPPGFKR